MSANHRPARAWIDRSVYPMPAFATLGVSDLEVSKHWYVESLGFALMAELPGADGAPGVVHLRRARYQDLLLIPSRGQAARIALSFAAAGEDLSGRARTLLAARPGRVMGPRPTPWNTTDLTAADPDHHMVTLTAPQAPRADGPMAQLLSDAMVRSGFIQHDHGR